MDTILTFEVKQAPVLQLSSVKSDRFARVTGESLQVEFHAIVKLDTLVSMVESTISGNTISIADLSESDRLAFLLD